MNNSFDGKSFKRTANEAGEKTPVVGVSRDRAIYTAVGGESYINLTLLTPTIQYNPGKNVITVKRSSVPVMISGIHFFESSPYSISFSTPLLANEKVEITKDFNVTAVMAVSTRPDIYTTVSSDGQTIVEADFFWYCNQHPTKSRGAVRVEIDGITKTRGIDYIELANGLSPMTTKIQFVAPLIAGKQIAITPTNQVIDSAIPQSQTYGADISDLKQRMIEVEASTSQNQPRAANVVRVENSTSEYSTSSTDHVAIPDMNLTITGTGRPIGINLNIKLYVDGDSSNWYRVVFMVQGPNGFFKWLDMINDDGFVSNKQRSFSLTEVINDPDMSAGQYTVTVLWACNTNITNNVLKQRFGMSLKAWEF